MNPQTANWVAKAEGDFDSALREARARIRPNFDSACFHAQQCAEKYLKARLVEAGIPFQKTHDLVLLLDLVLPIEPLWEAWRDDLSAISSFAVGLRYPDDFADKSMAQDAISRLQRFRKIARTSLDLTD